MQVVNKVTPWPQHIAQAHFSKAEGGRYAVGSILREGGSRSSEELEQRFHKAGFHLCSFPEVTHAVTTSCPHGTPLSVLLGARRMYTRLKDYIKMRWFPGNSEEEERGPGLLTGLRMRME
ncbi:unnamed protein product [Merluccius merluccius]